MVVLTSFSTPTEGIKHEEPSTKLCVNGRDVGTGTLYIAESALSWRNSQTGEGFSLLYPSISVHAITREIGNECLYLVVDTCLDSLMGVTNGGSDVGENSEDEDNEDEGRATEMRFVPEDKGVLEAMYHAMTQCQALHPDAPPDELSPDEEDEEYLDADDDDDDGDYIAANDCGPYIEDHVNDMDHSNGHRHGDEEMETDGQFEDAETEN